MALNQSPRLAVLIDAENASRRRVESLMDEIAKYGTATVRRAYGDWTKPGLKDWKETLLAHSIQPEQQFSYTSGKNASDSAMVIGAMDLLYTGRFDGFCIVSSDSDFTRLASRIREQGLTVYGFGEEKTPQPFVKACDKFIYTELLDAVDLSALAESAKKERKPSADRKLKAIFVNAIEAAADDDGWAHLGAVGSTLVKQSPDFDARLYGYRKLSDLARALNWIEVRETRPPGSGAATLHVKLKG